MNSTTNWIFIDKPAGFLTHPTPNSSKNNSSPINYSRNKNFHDFNKPASVLEKAEQIYRQKLFVVHRLDRDTSGVLLFAKDSQSAESLNALFRAHDVHKTYLFLTDRCYRNTPTSLQKVNGKAFTIESEITKIGGRWVSKANSHNNANSQTEFICLDTFNQFSLWQAKPKTGRTHQIRLHAQDAGLSILGDVEHGGSADFPRVALHATELTFAEHKYSSQAPLFFTQLRLLQNPRLVAWLNAIDRRERWFRSFHNPFDCWRWIHTEGDPLRIDQFASNVLLQWHTEQAPDTLARQDIEELNKLCGFKNSRLIHSPDRERTKAKHQTEDRSNRESTPEEPQRWIGKEHGIEYEFRSDTGLSPGLFLDQRANRLWVQKNSTGKSVLNLFSYTGGFSLNAWKGGAQQIVSVDISKSYMEWARNNFVLNGWKNDSPDKYSKVEFWTTDTQDYLKLAQKKGWKFDLIICDPPSFARRKQGAPFRIAQNLGQLIEACLAVLNPRGQILFSTHYEKWTTEQFLKNLQKSLDHFASSRKEERPHLVIQPAPQSPDWDFEVHGTPRLLHNALIQA